VAHARLGVDVGGTFTDLVVLDEGRLRVTKVLSTPSNQSVGVMAAWQAAGVDAGDIAAFAHGMTVATNALLERRGARTALVTTEGFRDVIEIGRQHRPRLYDLGAHPPPPLVPRHDRLTVSERMTPDGVLRALEPASVEHVVAALRAAEVESVAVCLLFSYLHPQHERAVAAAIRSALPELDVVVSSDVLPEFREYERFSTTVVDAYLTPLLRRYLTTLGERAAEQGLPEPLVMQSSGGVARVGAAADHAAGFVLSGPAGGVVGAARIAARSGLADLLTFDMGGTSTDVALVLDGVARTTTESVVAGVPIRLPMVGVHTVSSGGGSIARVDEGGALRVGPTSAGAVPGPACYDRGGEEPTVTDANLVLGYLRPQARLGGDTDGVVLQQDLARRSVATLATRLQLDVQDTAEGVLRVAEAEMGRALRVMSVQRGVDPRDLTLVAFGGAGGLHACALAEELGMTRVLLPRAAGVLSAVGLAVSGLRRDLVRPLLSRTEDVSAQQIRDLVTEMGAEARDELPDADVEGFVDLRYTGQSFELTIPAEPVASLQERFHEAHETRYGYHMANATTETVAVRAVASVPVDVEEVLELLDDAESAPAAGSTTGTAGVPDASRTIHLDGADMPAPVYTRADLGIGVTLEGPSVVELPDATCLVRPGWSGVVDPAGSLLLTRGDR
jgi:N-methylhydantoinase A